MRRARITRIDDESAAEGLLGEHGGEGKRKAGGIYAGGVFALLVVTKFRNSSRLQFPRSVVHSATKTVAI